MKFRIKTLPQIGSFAQVKGADNFFQGWRTIGQHVNGFGLYPNDHLDHPLSGNKEALSKIDEYKIWIRGLKVEPNYTNV